MKKRDYLGLAVFSILLILNKIFEVLPQESNRTLAVFVMLFAFLCLAKFYKFEKLKKEKA